MPLDRDSLRVMKIFGIGLNKTGTTSLGLAFAQLGYRHFNRRPAVFKLYSEGRFDEVFDQITDFDSFEDWPWPLMVPQLLEHYGTNAKFILTRRRTPEIWLESIKRHALRTHPTRNPRAQIFGAPYPQGNEALYLAHYTRHLETTRSYFTERSHQFLELCLDEGQGWEQLCPFLDQPGTQLPFPRANVSDEVDIPRERLAANLAAIASQVDGR